jgi:hypothetical protein
MYTRIAVFTITLIFLAGAACAQSIAITGPDRDGVVEGQTYSITWSANGIQSVSLVAQASRTPRGTTSRGQFEIAIAEGVPAADGSASWEVPWLDTVRFRIRAKGYNAQGQEVAATERLYNFRPAVMAERLEDGIYIDLSSETNQRLYMQRDYRLTRAYLTTSSENYLWRPPCSHIRTPHDHAGVFSIIEKKRSHWSELFQVEMPWAMRYHRGHFVHATSPNLYGGLGTASSGGCNRLTDHDARELYRMTSLGTRVEVIGPDG